MPVLHVRELGKNHEGDTMTDCDCCAHCSYHGIRRDGLPSTVYRYCEHFGHNRPPDNCTLFEEGQPRYFDKRGMEITKEELDAIPARMEGR